MNDFVEIQVVTPEDSSTIRVLPSDISLAELLRRHGYPLNLRCGQRTICDGCRIQMHRGQLCGRSDAGQTQEVRLDQPPIVLKACAWSIARNSPPLILHIPERSLLTHQPQVVSDFQLRTAYRLNPIDSPSDPTESTLPKLGAAVDVGTTTVALLLVDLSSGDIVGRASTFNRQMHLGDDVLTRINLCLSDPAMVDRLKQALWQQTIKPLIAKARHDLPPEQPVTTLVMAGNSTMQHLAAGINPSAMGMAPFTPVFLDHRVEPCRQSGIAGHGLSPESQVHLLPGASAYVGADIVAGVLSSGMADEDGPVLLVDVGTNGEIVLKTKGKMIGCATAAGPAFEGAGLTFGMRAGHGAIESVELHVHQAPLLQTIGRDTPMGICGSAYIDFLAQARRINLIDPMGHFDPAIAGEHLIPWPDGQQAYRLTQIRGKEPIVITQRDIAVWCKPRRPSLPAF